MSSLRVRVLLGLVALGVCFAASGCALFNSADIQLVRSISVGQEMIDLKRAADEGAISQAEYAELKGALMDLADVEGMVDLIDEDSDD